MTFLGLKIIGNLGVTLISNEKDVYSELEKFSQIISDYLMSKERIQSDKLLNSCFISLKNQIEMQKEFRGNEYMYWLENKYFECNNFSDVLNNIYNNNTTSQLI